MDNKKLFCEEANKILYKRGFNTQGKYFRLNFHQIVFDDWFEFCTLQHPNGKKFNEQEWRGMNNKKLAQAKRWTIELFGKLMTDYNININDIMF